MGQTTDEATPPGGMHRRRDGKIILISRLSVGLVAAVFLTCLCPKASAEDLPQTEDLIIFAKEQALWVTSSAGQAPKRLLELPMAAEELESIRVSSDGSALIIAGKGFVGWAALSESNEAALRMLPCSGPSNISADGNRVVCGTQDARRIAVYTLVPTLGVKIINSKSLGPLAFAEAAHEIIGFGANDKVIAMSIVTKEQRVVAEHHPKSAMAVSPDGKRAIGAYDEGTIDVVYTFRLDGKAAKRTLVHAARAIHISADSQWAAVQQEVDACAVRLLGGQYMCWRRYRALAISSQGRSLLLAQASAGKRELLLGAVTGTRARNPLLLVKGAARVATFWTRLSLRE